MESLNSATKEPALKTGKGLSGHVSKEDTFISTGKMAQR
jgi:hypothetical protein